MENKNNIGERYTSNKILNKKDIICLFNYKEKKMKKLFEILPCVKIGNDYIMTEKDLLNWIEKNKGKDINI